MILSQLKPVPGSRKKRKRVGRGEASGSGGTAGKGHKGQRARSGGPKGRGFEGGQMPLQRRIPKRGFRNIFKKRFKVINLARLAALPANTEVTPLLLKEKGWLRNETQKVKLLANGEIKNALTIKLHAVSEQATKKIEQAGGKVEVIE